MGKRYTYYRTPEGKPYNGADDKHAPVHILAEIGKTATLIPKGISWPDLLITRLQVTLKPSLVVLDPRNVELNETDTWDMVWQAVGELVKNAPGKPVNPIELLKRVDKSAATYFRTPPAKYVLVSSLSIKDLPSRSIIVQDCTISSLRKRGKRFAIPRMLALQLDGSPFSKHINNSQYRLVKVSTEGRSKYDATERALNSINLLRGLWSLIATYGFWTTSGRNTRKPLGVIHTGPIHTLHFPGGGSVDNNLFWYDPDCLEDQSIYEPKEGWKEIEKKRRLAMKQLARLEYKNELEAVLIRYADALDQPNTDTAFLKMWGILERITNTIGTNYNETIKKTLWPYRNDTRPLAKNMLESLRYCRNRYVHSGRGDQQSDQVAYLIKSFVDPHLFMLISNTMKVRSLEEYGKFLDLPTDATTIKEMSQRLMLSLRMLNS